VSNLRFDGLGGVVLGDEALDERGRGTNGRYVGAESEEEETS
jgi:hypothetical protein